MRHGQQCTGIKDQLRTSFVVGLLCVVISTYGQPTSGLVAYYPFNGNANDQTANANHGTVTGAMLIADRSGNAGSAYFLDGSGDYIEVPNSASLQFPNAVTISMWINFVAGGGGLNPRIFSKLGSGGFEMWTAGNSASRLIGAHSYSVIGMNSTSPVLASSWNHVVFTFDGTTSSIYTNGALNGTGTVPPTNSSGNLIIGTSIVNGLDQFHGSIDDIRIYDRALSLSEVQELYDEDLPVPVARIITFAPTSGPAGTSVTITGTDFSTTPSDNAVFFGSAKATVTSATTTTLVVSAPGNTTFAPLSVSANGITSYATRAFNLTFPGDAASNFTTSSFSAAVSFTLSGGPRKVVIGDLNGDGKSDLAIANNGADKLTLMENIHISGAISASSFASPVNLNTGGTEAHGVAIGDINSDGKPDIAVVNKGSNNVSLYQNLSNSGTITTSSFSANIDLTTGTQPYDVAIYDLDLDGRPEIITSNASGASISIFQNQMSGTTITAGGFAARVNLSAGGTLTRLAVRDLDADNRPEIVAANDGLDKVSVFKNLTTPGAAISSGSFQAKVDFTPGGLNPENVAIGNITNDDKPEITTANPAGNNVSSFRNTTTAGTIDASSFAAPANNANHNVAHGVSLGDLNGDGKPDMVVGYAFPSPTTGIVGVRRNNSAVTVAFDSRVEFASGGITPLSTAIGDIDGDNRPDIVVANGVGINISVLRNVTAVTEPANQPTNIGFSNVADVSMTVSLTAASSSPTGYIGLWKTGSSPTDVPADGTTYTAGSSIGSSTVGFVGTGTSFNVTGLSPATLHHFDIFSYNAAGAYNYLTSSPLEGSRTTYASQPAAQPTSMTFSSIDHAGMTVNFSAPGVPPTGYLALMNSTGSPTETPVDATSYTQGNPFGASTIAYIGAGNSFSVSGLSPATTYYFDIFAYNGTTGTYNYLTSSPLEGSQTTFVEPPTAQPANISFSSITDAGMTVNFNAAASTPVPTGYIALMSSTGSPTGAPENGTGYTAGDMIGGRPVVYVGSGTSFSVTGLAASTMHYFDIFSYNGTTGTYNYLTTSPLEGSQTTYAELPTAQPAGISFSSISNDGMTVTFTAAAGPPTGYIALMSYLSSPTETPLDGTEYTQGNSFGTSTIVYVGSGTSFPVTGLWSGTTYYFDIFSYNGTTGTYRYLTSSPLEGGRITYAESPTAQPTAIGFSSITDAGMTVGFTSATGSAVGYLALMNTSGSPTEAPLTGTSYSPGDAIGSSTVAFVGSGYSFPVTGLSPATTYYFDIFSYNGTTDTYNYLTSTPLEGSQTTFAIPSAQPTGITFSAISHDGMTVSFTEAAGSPTGYIGLLYNPVIHGDVPVSGTSYSPGSLIGGSVVAFAGSGTSFSVTGLSASTYYYISVYSYNVTTGVYNYLTASPLEGQQTTMASPPIEQPTGIVFSSLSNGGMTVSFTDASGILAGYLALINGTSSPTEVPVNGTGYSAGDPIGSSTVAFAGSGTSFPVTGLSSSTVYYFDIFSYNGTTGTYHYLATSPLEGSQTTSADPPTAQPTDIIFSSVDNDEISVSFTAAAGPPTGYIALMNATGSPTESPVNGTEYAAGNMISTSVVAYVGINNSFTVSGLSPSTVYNFDIFSYNGTTGTYSYLATAPLEGSQTTHAAAPSAQPTNISFSSITDAGMTVNFAAAAGPSAGYIALMSAAGSPTDFPVDGFEYSQGGTLTSSAVVYVGTGTSFTVTGLAPSTDYSFDIFSYNGTTGTYSYLTTSPLEGSQTTYAEAPPAQPTAIEFSSVSDSGMTVSFTSATGSPAGYLAIISSTGSPTEIPANGTGYSAGDPIGARTVAYTGTATSFSVSGLSPSTVYSFDIFSFNGTTGTYTYLDSAPLEGSHTTYAAPPTSQPANIAFSSISDAGMTVTFSHAGGPPTGYIALMNASGSPTEVPVNGTSYSQGSPFGSSTVEYFGSSNSFSVGGLSPSTVYYFDIFSFNGTTGTYNYLTSSPLESSQTTYAAEPLSPPGNISITSVTAGGMTVNFTAASGSPTGYIALYDPFGGPAFYPQDGTTYTPGYSFGTTTVGFVGAGNSFSVTGLSYATTYNWFIFSYNGTTGTINYQANSYLYGIQATLPSEPAFPPTSISFSSVTASSMDVSFTQALGVPSGYLVLRKDASSPTVVPVDGSVYNTGSTLADNSVVAYAGSSTSFGVTGLQSETVYHYDIYSYNLANGAYNYLESTPLEGSHGTLAAEPSFQSGSMSFSSITETGMTVTFSGAPGPPSGYLALIRDFTSPTDPPTDGVSYTVGTFIGSAQVAFAGAGNSFFVTGLAASTTYYFDVFSYNGTTGTYNYLTSGPLEGSQTTYAGPPGGSPTSISFNFVTATDMTVSFLPPAVYPSGFIALRRAGSAPTETPVDGTFYQAGTNFGNSYIAYNGNSTAFTLNNLTPGTTYYYQIYSYNGATGTYNYLESQHLDGSQTTLASQPSFAPTNISFSSISETSMTVNFSAAFGSPSGYIGLVRSGTWPINEPADGVSYTPGAFIGSSQIAFVGTGNSFTVSGLSPFTTYYYYIFSYNGTTGTYNYLTNNILTGSQSTLANEPAGPPTSISFSLVTSGAMNVNFAPAPGFPSGYIALRRGAGFPVDAPADGPSYNVGSTIGNSVVAYMGNGTSFGVNGLQPETVYLYDIYSYSEANGTYNYLQSSHLVGSQSTLAVEPGFQPFNIGITAVTENSLSVTFDPAPGPTPSGYIAIVRANGFPFENPVDGVIYPVDASFGGGKVGYVGSGTSFTVTGLSPSTNYYINLHTYNGAAGTINYFNNSPTTYNRSTLASQPTAQSTGISYSGVSTNSMNVSLVPAAGIVSGYIVLRKAGSAPTEIPVDGTTYFSNTNWPNSTTVIVHVGSNTTFFSGSLSSGTEYYYRVFSYNGSSGTSNYLESNPLVGSQYTVFPEPTSQPGIPQFTNPTETGMTVTFTPAAGPPSGYIGLVRATTSPGIPPTDGVNYTPGTSVGGGESTVAFIGTGTSFNVTGLLPSTVYHFDVFSYNGVSGLYNFLTNAPSENSRTTLAPEPTAQPTTIAFTNLQRNSVTVSWVATSTPGGYIVLRSTGTQADPPPDGAAYAQGALIGGSTVAYSGQALTFSDTGLSPTTTYYYSIYAYNGSALSSNYRTNLPATANVTTPLDTTPPTATPTPGSTAFVVPGQKATITVQLADQESQPTGATLQYRYVAQGGTINDAKMNLVGGNWSAEIPASSAGELGIEYRIVSKNAAGIEGGPQQLTLIPVNYSSLPVKYSSFYTTPSSKVKSFRIISIPAELESKTFKKIFEDELGPYDEKSWRVYRFENGSTRDVSEKEYEAGKGYWLIARGPEKPLQTGSGTSVVAKTDQHFKVALTAGWNQIGNPYNFNVKWQTVVDRNKDLELRSLKVFNGTEFAKEPNLNKMEGGFVYAGKAGDLYFPVVKDASINSRTQETTGEPEEHDPNGWILPLTLTQSDMTSSLPGIGMHRDAREDFDRFDDLSMPRFLEYLELNHFKNIRGNPLNVDIVPLKEANTWKFRVESSSDKDEITISWPDTEGLIRPDLELFLVDEAEDVSVDMRSTRSYTFSSARSFKIIYGSEQYLSSELPEGKGKILTVYPNPAKQELAAVVAIPSWNKEYEVSIDLVNALGQSTVVMYSGILASGTHTVEWNGFERRPPAGVYFIRMVCNGHVSIQRIVLQ